MGSCISVEETKNGFDSSSLNGGSSIIAVVVVVVVVVVENFAAKVCTSEGAPNVVPI